MSKVGLFISVMSQEEDENSALAVDDFDQLVDHYDKIKGFKLHNAKQILMNFRDNDNFRFKLTEAETEKKSNLSSTAACAYAIAEYSDLWKLENNWEMSSDLWDFCRGINYYNYIVDEFNKKIKQNSNGMADQTIELEKYPDEFTTLNILSLLKNIQKSISKIDIGKLKKDSIKQTVLNLCNELLKNELIYNKAMPHPFIYYKFLDMVDDWAEDIFDTLVQKENDPNAGSNEKWNALQEDIQKINDDLNIQSNEMIINEIENISKKMQEEFKKCYKIFNKVAEVVDKTNLINVASELILDKFEKKYANFVTNENLDSLKELIKTKLNSNTFEEDANDFNNRCNKIIIEIYNRKVRSMGAQKIRNFFFESVYEKAKYELYRQITFYVSNDETMFDVKRLIYSLLIITRDDKYSDNLVKRKALEIIFKNQFKTGMLPIGNVVSNDFVIEQNGKISQKYVSATPIITSVECLRDMLEHKHLSKYLNEYSNNFKIAAEWIIESVRKDTNTGSYLGWYKEYESTHTPESWVAAHSILFLKSYCDMLSEKISESAGTFLNVKKLDELEEKAKEWNQLFDTYRAKEYLSSMGPGKSYRSAFLFGPPGTGKTSTAKSLARMLKMDYVEITPGRFLADGDSKIIQNANEIFKRLARMKNTLIFFDEVDQLVKTRGISEKNVIPPLYPTKHSESSDIWIVTSLLPKFQDLHDNEDVLFILATNDMKKVDSAMRRQGRIDLILPMGAICWRTRILRLHDAVKKYYGESFSDEEPNNEIYNKIFPRGANGEALVVNELNKDLLDKKTINKFSILRTFLERTNYLTVHEFSRIIDLFTTEKKKKISENMIQEHHLFKIFFNGEDQVDAYSNSQFKDFHDKLLANDYPCIRLPIQMRGSREKRNEEIRGNVLEHCIF